MWACALELNFAKLGRYMSLIPNGKNFNLP
jgi:hypothetical protein